MDELWEDDGGDRRIPLELRSGWWHGCAPCCCGWYNCWGSPCCCCCWWSFKFCVDFESDNRLEEWDTLCCCWSCGLLRGWWWSWRSVSRAALSPSNSCWWCLTVSSNASNSIWSWEWDWEAWRKELAVVVFDLRSSGGSPYLLLPFVPLLSCCRDCVEDFIVLGLPRSPRRKYTRVNIKILSKRREHPGKTHERKDASSVSFHFLWCFYLSNNNTNKHQSNFYIWGLLFFCVQRYITGSVDKSRALLRYRSFFLISPSYSFYYK